MDNDLLPTLAIIINQTLRASKLCRDDAIAKGFVQGHGGISMMMCPVCLGIVNYNVAGMTARINAKCETPKCLEWFQ